MKRPLVWLALVACMLAGRPVMAADLPEGGMTATEVANWLRSDGLTAEVKPDPTTPGDQIVSTSSDGLNWDIYFYSCSSLRCKSIQYTIGWTGSMESSKILAWDRDYRFIRAYLSNKGEPFGEYDLDISPGGTYSMLERSLTRWRSAMVDFKKQLYPNG